MTSVDGNRTAHFGFMSEGREGGRQPVIEVSQLEKGGRDGHDTVDLAFTLPTQKPETPK